MKEYNLQNPRPDMDYAIIQCVTHNGKDLVTLYHRFKNQKAHSADYIFNSVTACKRYFSTNYQRVSWGFEKPIWVEKAEEIISRLNEQQ